MYKNYVEDASSLLESIRLSDYSNPSWEDTPTLSSVGRSDNLILSFLLWLVLIFTFYLKATFFDHYNLHPSDSKAVFLTFSL